MLFIIVFIILIAVVGYVFIMYKKNELTDIPEIASIKEKPIMPSINTSYFLSKEKEILGLGAEKLTDYTIENIAFPNYHRGYFFSDDNLFALVSQNLPNVIQKYLGLSDLPYISIISVFDDGSDLISNTNTNKFQADISSYRRFDHYEELPLTSIIEKHKIRIDLIEAKGPTALKMDKEDFIKYMLRGLKIDLSHKNTKGYETKADMETIMNQLGLNKKKTSDNSPSEEKENNSNEGAI